MGLQLFDELNRTTAAYCRALGLDATPYQSKLSPAEIEVAAFLSTGINRRSAEMFVALNHMPAAPLRVQPSSVHRCIVEYARPAQPVSLWDKQDITPFYEECRVRSPHSAGIWIGD